MKDQLIELPIPTCEGRFIARYTSKGLGEIDFPQPEMRHPGGKSQAIDVPADIRAWHDRTRAALNCILNQRPPADLPPLDPAGTEFQRSVWKALRRIPFGKTRTYGEIAQAIGKPGAVRAVGGACGANPIPVLIPCHRVLAANEKIGGFSSGLKWKRILLAREGVCL